MKRLGKISQLFCEHWGEKTRTAAARKALEALIAGASRAEIPVNVEAAARYLGIERLVYAELMDSDGSLAETSSGRYIATVRSAQSDARRRFTLAHEVGHAIVLRSLGSEDRPGTRSRTACRPVTPDEKDEEQLCDLIASELLMPRAKFVAVMEETGVSAETVPEIARRFEVSLQACARKVAQLLPYEVGLGLWSKDDERGHVIPKWYLTRKGLVSLEYVIEVGGPGSACFTEKRTSGWQWIPLHGPMDKYYIDVCPLRGASKSWLCLVVFSDSAQHIMATISKGRLTETGQLPLLEG